ncbi:AcrR family transcriptional regulator [Spinactinospora alkalitolerans]|uniref:AcrR family transcriptional regulator n=1 Tax=Spinactinospora alkalitolerans TaxID=687207 RepID=A0A852TSS1_9ACTN|nr:TetR/AcrR family transcriptional regulator [Spinactinospora alkalitolerans]NYE46575.1 AcrR family transcriptional regulator [Spinactinospora alkalitolerans]
MPRAGLTPATVAEEAARLCDENGYGRLSLAAVAKRLGVAVPSLYKHVNGLEGLRRDVAVLSAREFGEVLGRAAMGRSEADAVRTLAAAYRSYARTRPGRYAAVQRAPDPVDDEAIAASNSVLEVILAVFRGFDLPEEALIDAVRVFRSAVHGFVDLEARGGFGLPQSTDHTYEVLVDGLITALRNWPRPSAGAGGEAS